MGAHTILLCAYVIAVSITEVAYVRNVLAKHPGAVGHAILSCLAPAVAGRPRAEGGSCNVLSWRRFQPQGVDAQANAGPNRGKRTREFLEG